MNHSIISALFMKKSQQDMANCYGKPHLVLHHREKIAKMACFNKAIKLHYIHTPYKGHHRESFSHLPLLKPLTLWLKFGLNMAFEYNAAVWPC